MHRLFLAAVAVSLGLAASAPAYALCVMCNSTVRLNGSLAQYFAERLGDVESRLAKSGKPYIIVDLSDCASRDALPTGGGTNLVLDKQFVADDPALKCLAAKIAATDDTGFDPSHVFDLNQDCPAQ